MVVKRENYFKARKINAALELQPYFISFILCFTSAPFVLHRNDEKLK
jgi:hypothetical protein